MGRREGERRGSGQGINHILKTGPQGRKRCLISVQTSRALEAAFPQRRVVIPRILFLVLRNRLHFTIEMDTVIIIEEFDGA